MDTDDLRVTTRTKLTAGEIEAFHCPVDKPQAFIWDSEVPGLAVRATAGSKSFVFQGKLAGRSLRITIGDTRAWSLDTPKRNNPLGQRGAREEARRLKTLLDQDIDPREQKRDRIAAIEAKRAEAKRRDAKARDAWDAYLAARAKDWSPRHLFDHVNLARAGGEPMKRGKRLTTPGPLAQLLDLRLVEMTPERVEEWLDEQKETRPTQTRLAFGALRAFLHWCEKPKHYPGLAHPDACGREVAKEHAPKKQVKDDCLERAQLAPWFAAVRSLDPVLAAYLQGLLITGARREELAHLTWDDLDLKWNRMTIRDKVDGTRAIPLTPYLASLLDALPRRKRNPWVFSSPTAETGRLQDPRRAHARALAIAEIEGLTLHGLRRSFATLSEWVECPVGITAQIMGHKPSATAERHYKKRPLDLLRLWHARIEGWMLQEAGIEFDPAQAEASRGLRLVANK